MQRRNVVVAVVALIMLSIGGLATARLMSPHGGSNATLVAARPTSCDDTYRVLKLAPSQISTAKSVCLVQSLQISGELHGLVAQAYPVEADGIAATQMCSVPKRWNNYPQALLAFVIGSKAYRLRISPPGFSEHQALALRNLSGNVELASIADPKADWNQASGTVGLNADGITGAIDADLVRDVSGARPVHVSGRWACGAPISLAVDSNLPCSRFYTLNHLQASDVDRMKAQACKPQDLTFSSAVSDHLDRAVNDAAISPHPGIDGDNFCGAVGYQYTASLKFSSGDETFLLDLVAGAYPSVGPGQYPAATQGLTPGAFLWLGHADPDNNGQFVTDKAVAWEGSGGSFTIGGDLKSGTIDATLQGLQNPNSAVHITGSWRCA